MDKYSPYVSECGVVDLLAEGGGEVVGLDGSGKVVRWGVEEEQGGEQVLRGSHVVELRHLVQRMALQAYSIKKRGER